MKSIASALLHLVISLLEAESKIKRFGGKIEKSTQGAKIVRLSAKAHQWAGTGQTERIQGDKKRT